MKKNSIFCLLIIFCLFLSACASNKPPRERSDDYIADVNIFEVGTVHLYTTINFSKPKISDFYVTFSPRTNTLFVKARIGIDVVRLGFSYEERKSINEAFNQYLEAYEQHNIPNVKPNKKNALSKGEIYVGWGGLGTAHHVNTTYRTNTQYLEKTKPYFKITLDTLEEEKGSQIYSPAACIYISPKQWETIVELCNQEKLEQMTDDILDQANAF